MPAVAVLVHLYQVSTPPRALQRSDYQVAVIGKILSDIYRELENKEIDTEYSDPYNDNFTAIF